MTQSTPEMEGAARSRRIKSTVRMRLTLLYSALFVVSGSALLAIVYLLVKHQIAGPFSVGVDTGHHAGQPGDSSAASTAATSSGSGPSAALGHFLSQSALALLVMTALSIAFGWFLAGRLLSPLRHMTNTARRISEHNLHERLALTGRPTELSDLADTINGLLSRLQNAFDAQRRFIANVSHELRTPLTVSRAMMQVSLADPDLTLDQLRSTCTDVLATEREQERTLDALLTLAIGQRGLDHRDPVDLAAIATQAVDRQRDIIASHGITVKLHSAPAACLGDAHLLARLASNVIDNAIRYNIASGQVHVTTSRRGNESVLTVVNTGPVVEPDEIGRLTEPFQRHDRARTNSAGLGIGLSIVVAIANAHDADLSIRPRSCGGLDIRIAFPGAPDE